MPSVKNLEIKVQSGTTNAYLATWEFADQKVVDNTTIQVGSLVSINPGATYYNGVSIPDFVMSDRWYVIEVGGDRAVLGENESRSYNICSPINIADITAGSVNSVRAVSDELAETLEQYHVEWFYDSGDALWYRGTSTDTKDTFATYSIPANALLVKVEVTPVAKKHKVNDQEVEYWTGTTASAEAYPDRNPPEKVSVPTVTLTKFKMVSEITNIADPKADKIEFAVYNGEDIYQTGVATVSTARAAYTCQLPPGGDFRVRARAINIVGSGQLYGAWSDFSESYATIPSPPEHILECRANSKTSVYLSWSAVPNTTEYTISYTNERRYFDTASDVNEVTGVKLTNYELTGLEPGKEYFFRVAAANDQGASDWSEIKSTALGSKPAAPTTWASSTTVITGEPLTLYWIHNAADNSREVRAQVELTIGDLTNVFVVENTTSEDDEPQPGKYVIDTNPYNEGTIIKWRVKTCGVTQEYGEYSVLRTVNIYAQPSVILQLTDTSGNSLTKVTTLPVVISANTIPGTQTPIGYYLTVYSRSAYVTRDSVGEIKRVNVGDQIFGRYYDVTTPLSVTLGAGDLDLFDGATYILECVASMNSGLTAKNFVEFTVSWSIKTYEPNAEIAIDPKIYAAYIQPYCRNADGQLVENVTLSLYRKEFNGDYILVAEDLDNMSNTVVTDPHPALDYARYRIVARDTTNGVLSYYDLPPYPVSGKAIILQWDEHRKLFATKDPNSLVVQPYTGSMLVLPYNIEVSDSPAMEVELVNYIGRENPIAYYGTQKGYSASWNTVIPKTDVDTLYAIRKLANWAGNVYVREPSGSGYWANVGVSYSQKYDDLTIPITFNIKRVEGGV